LLAGYALWAVAFTPSAVAPRPAAVEFKPSAGTIVLHDRVSRYDTVAFYFAASTPAPRAEARVREAATSAGLSDRGTDVSQQNGVAGALRVDLTTTLGRETGFLARTVDGSLASSSTSSARVVSSWSSILGRGRPPARSGP